MTTEWDEWSRCSSECGNGLRKRSRQYKDPKAAMGVCNEVLNDTEMCLSENGECDFDRAPNPSEMQASNMFQMPFNLISNKFLFLLRCLLLTTWSEWSPCSKECGVGTTVRVRKYIHTNLENKCESKLREEKSCIVKEKCVDENLLSTTERKSKTKSSILF